MSSHKAPGECEVTVTVASLHAGLQPLCSNEHHCWCTMDLWVYRFTYASGTLCRVFRLPPKSSSLTGRVKDTLARSWLRRKLKPGTSIDAMVELANGTLVIIFDRVYWYSPDAHGKFAEVLAAEFPVPVATPLRGGAAVHVPSQRVYYGEYLNGHECDIRVCRVDVAARTTEVCWSFPRSEIKHIHAIHYDRFRNRLWICTGDRDHESAFYYTDDEFESVYRFAGGDQSWRAIAILFDQTGMEWGMDAGKDAPASAINRIYRYDFPTGLRTELAVIGNPAYAACEFTDGTAVMQTSFEPGRLQDTPEAASLWFRDTNQRWSHCFSLPYQLHRRGGAGRYGSISLPTGVSPTRRLLITPVNCSSGNNKIHEIQLSESHK